MKISYYVKVGNLYVSDVDGIEHRVLDGTGYVRYGKIYGLSLDAHDREEFNPKQAKSVHLFLTESGVGGVRIVKVETPQAMVREITIEEL